MRSWVPASQACCGLMHVNTGYFREAVPVIRNHVEAFAPVLDGTWDAVVGPSGSCTGSIRHQQGMVCRREDDVGLGELSEAIAAKTYELSELLVDVLVGMTDVGAYLPHWVDGDQHPRRRAGSGPARNLSGPGCPRVRRPERSSRA